jgi:hypothetical protein
MVATDPWRPRATVTGVRGPDDVAEISDDELTALALAADPDAPIAADAEPWPRGGDAAGLLPSWYMPAAVRRARRAHRAVVALVVGALLVVSGAGLCVTSGFPEIAW